MSIYSEEKVFYVYMYLRCKNTFHGKIGSPYYIGKGTKNRAFMTRKFKPKDINNIKFYATKLTEGDAFFLEIMLIAKYGRLDNKTGGLWNRTDSGEGSVGIIDTEETRKRRSDSHKGKPSGAKGMLCSNELRKIRSENQTIKMNKLFPKKECEYCKKLVTDRIYNKEHGNNCIENPNIESIQCKYCDKIFISKNLKYHINKCKLNPNISI
jgi:hypothetical protein